MYISLFPRAGGTLGIFGWVHVCATGTLNPQPIPVQVNVFYPVLDFSKFPNSPDFRVAVFQKLMRSLKHIPAKTKLIHLKITLTQLHHNLTEICGYLNLFLSTNLHKLYVICMYILLLVCESITISSKSFINIILPLLQIIRTCTVDHQCYLPLKSVLIRFFQFH